jgi:hypothetical protein
MSRFPRGAPAAPWPASRRRGQLRLSIKNKRPEAHARGAGPQHRGPVLNSLFYLPTSIALLFFLAASLLLGLM